MSTKDQDDYDDFCRLQPAPRWDAFKAERDRADLAEAELKRWPTTDAGRLSDEDLSEICHLVAHLSGETVIEQVAAAVVSSASSEPTMLDEDTHPWPTDGSEFEVIFKRPESVIATYVQYKNRHLTTDGYSITDYHREPEGWLPITAQGDPS